MNNTSLIARVTTIRPTIFLLGLVSVLACSFALGQQPPDLLSAIRQTETPVSDCDHMETSLTDLFTQHLNAMGFVRVGDPICAAKEGNPAGFSEGLQAVLGEMGGFMTDLTFINGYPPGALDLYASVGNFGPRGFAMFVLHIPIEEGQMLLYGARIVEE